MGGVCACGWVGGGGGWRDGGRAFFRLRRVEREYVTRVFQQGMRPRLRKQKYELGLEPMLGYNLKEWG